MHWGDRAWASRNQEREREGQRKELRVCDALRARTATVREADAGGRLRAHRGCSRTLIGPAGRSDIAGKTSTGLSSAGKKLNRWPIVAITRMISIIAK